MSDRTTLIAIAFAALLVGSVVGAGLAGLAADANAADSTTAGPLGDSSEPELTTFESESEFEQYFRQDRSRAVTLGGPPIVRGSDDVADDVEVEEDAAAGGAPDDAADEAYTTSSRETTDERRHSETNVQEEALDEPDVLKTDGQSVYYADYRYTSRWSETSVVDVSDPADPEPVASIPLSGDLLLVEDTLVVLGDDAAAGYDVSDPADPDRLWREDLGAEIETARLYDGDLYLVLVDRPGSDPCPIEPYGDRAVECTDVVRPDAPANADAVYTAARVDPETGSLESQESVVGSRGLSATYVSENAIYLSYTRTTSQYELLQSYVTSENGSALVDAETRERAAALEDLDISERAKEIEMREIIDDWFDRMDEKEREKLQREFDDGLEAHVEAHHRELTTTGIVRIGIDGDLRAEEHGEVPGTPLNQFSMDEHDDHVRIATTIPRSHGIDSENDVYVLDSDLEITGEVTGLGVDERIYSVRFEGDEGHVVTFREIDPFYTLDLSDPTDPVVEGELKLPGFSEYLHPLSDDLVLGVGQEDRQPKVTLFDVSDRDDPVELDSRILEDERYSDVSRTHTAFLQDEAHDVFFVPGSDDSYVFGYEGGELEEVARVDVGGHGARAMYVDDYLYVFGEDEVVVLDERTWEEHRRLEL
ncbi:Secreted protein containing C-terminal beta-propeller domain [Halobiforma haloterrestris]|uniref:Secreted protein containing C-terminal beta-propeller domain n=1 Tax=Natronobacterium haloterrestre TaxID=148448 RepID=A0A1I1CZP5_NATHA|nr:beta-propeller domain-containing protein [Halobiforma haloterrestris]SFB67546.1 Secreted protein containing C-terminal beta-propeller domain [Halobiforma haloterrestris]